MHISFFLLEFSLFHDTKILPSSMDKVESKNMQRSDHHFLKEH